MQRAEATGYPQAMDPPEPERQQTALAFRCAGLHEHGPALRRATDVQGPTHFEPFAIMIYPPNARWVGEQRGIPITHQGVVPPGAPQRAGNFHELVGAVVVSIPGQLFVASEIACLCLLERGHDIPRGSPPAQVVQGCHRSRHREWLEVGCQNGPGEAYMFGRAGDQPQDHQRVQAQCSEGAVAQLTVKTVTQPILADLQPLSG